MCNPNVTDAPEGPQVKIKAAATLSLRYHKLAREALEMMFCTVSYYPEMGMGQVPTLILQEMHNMNRARKATLDGLPKLLSVSEHAENELPAVLMRIIRFCLDIPATRSQTIRCVCLS